MAKTISFSIFKGGTGKTTTAVNTSALLAEMGKKVLLVDLDQQASSTRYVGLEPEQINPTLFHVFRNQVPASVARKQTDFGFDLIPSSSLMAAIEEALENSDDLLLRTILAPLQEEYDYILLDTPPGKAHLSFNSMLAADYIIIPCSAERMAVDGLNDMIKHIQQVVWHKYPEETNKQEIRILFTMFKKHTTHSPGVVERSKKMYRDNVLDMFIPETIEFPRSFDQRKPINVLTPKHQATKAYRLFAKWITKTIV